MLERSNSYSSPRSIAKKALLRPMHRVRHQLCDDLAFRKFLDQSKEQISQLHGRFDTKGLRRPKRKVATGSHRDRGDQFQPLFRDGDWAAPPVAGSGPSSSSMNDSRMQARAGRRERVGPAGPRSLADKLLDLEPESGDDCHQPRSGE